MQRIYKFRAWDKFKDVPDMVYFDLDILQEGKTVLIGSIVDTELMQYTGLKDKNEFEMYESDIVRDAVGRIGKVEMGRYVTDNELNEDIQGYMYLTKERAYALDPQGDYEVIGNIWENSELLSSDNK